MRRIEWISVPVVILALVFMVWAARHKIHEDAGRLSAHIAPAALYPDPNLTPGRADTLLAVMLLTKYTSNCPNNKPSCTYSQAHRNVSAREHTQVYSEYNVPAAARNGTDGEVDHFYPLCAGGSNDISNLWYQPAVNVWQGQDYGFHAKDKLETYVCAQIKLGKLDPKDAYARITTDWVAYYQSLGLSGAPDVESSE